jgi:hypothetical protein
MEACLQGCLDMATGLSLEKGRTIMTAMQKTKERLALEVEALVGILDAWHEKTELMIIMAPRPPSPKAGPGRKAGAGSDASPGSGEDRGA